MGPSRRQFVRSGGTVALLGLTALAGCQDDDAGVGGGNLNLTGTPAPPTERNWQFDPATVAATQNRFFGSVDYGQLYEIRDQLSPSARDSFEPDEDAPVTPEQIDRLTGVGGAQLSFSGRGSATMFGSLGLLGSFEGSVLADQVDQGEAAKIGTYNGFVLYENAQSTTDSVGDVPSSASATAAIADGAMLVGVSGTSRTGDPPVSGTDAVKAMIDAGTGDGALLADNSEYAVHVTEPIGDSTIRFGGEVSPEVRNTFLQTPSGARYAQFLEGARAAGLGMDVGADVTTMTMLAVYEDASSAEATRIVELLDRTSEDATENSDIDEISAEYRNATVVVTIEGDTEAMFEEGTDVGGTTLSMASTSIQ